MKEEPDDTQTQDSSEETPPEKLPDVSGVVRDTTKDAKSPDEKRS